MDPYTSEIFTPYLNRFTYKGVFDVTAASREAVILRTKRDNEKVTLGSVTGETQRAAYIVGGLDRYLHTIEAVRIMLLHGRGNEIKIGEWYIVPIEGSSPILIRHLHAKELTFSTTYCEDKWACYCCGDPVPPGVLWIARTHIIGSAR